MNNKNHITVLSCRLYINDKRMRLCGEICLLFMFDISALSVPTSYISNSEIKAFVFHISKKEGSSGGDDDVHKGEPQHESKANCVRCLAHRTINKTSTVFLDEFV